MAPSSGCPQPADAGDRARHDGSVRWESLFADLAGEMEEAERAERAAEVADRSRAEAARLRLVDRLRPAVGTPVRLWARTGHRFDGRVAAVGGDWVLLDQPAGQQVLVPLSGVESLAGLGADAAVPGSEGQVAGRLTLGYALRRLARDRLFVQLCCASGTVLAGTLQRVGADFVELREHAPAERPPAAAGRLVAFAALVAVRSG